MSIPKKLSSASVGASLSGGHLLGVDSAGTVRRVTAANAVKNAVTVELSVPGWVRVASFTSANALLSVGHMWRSQVGGAVVLNAALHMNNTAYNDVRVVSSVCNVNGRAISVKKVRVILKSNSKSYLDIYYDNTGRNDVTVSVLANMAGDVTLLEPQLDPAVPEGYEVKEFDFSSEIARGGGNWFGISALRFGAERRCA